MPPPEPRHRRASNSGPFTLDGTRTYLVGERSVAVIDPGPDDPGHLRGLVRLVEDAEEVRILVTHAHADHAGGARTLAALLDAPLLGPLSGPAPGEDGGVAPAGGGGAAPGGDEGALAGDGGADPHGHEEAVRPDSGGAAPLREGDAVETDRGALIALSTPGHAREHLTFHWPEGRAAFPGDLVLGVGDTTWVGEYPGCVADYLRSLERLRDLDVDVLYPTHGPPVTDPEATLRRYRAHREERIREVEAVVAADPTADAGEVVRRVYGDAVPDGLRGAARRSAEVLLHHVRSRSGEG